MDPSRSVVVTGGSRGWGKGVVLKYAAPDTRIFLNYLQNDEAANQTAEEARSLGADVVAVKADMGTEEGVAKLFSEVSEAGGKVDVLVYNAFQIAGGPPLELDVKTLERCFAVGPTAFLRCVQQAVPLMGEEGGRIICTGSVATRRLFSIGGTGYFPMAVAKGGEEVMVRYLAVELGKRNITVNMVIAGWIATEYVVEGFTEDRLRRIQRRTPLNRPLGTVEEMANVVHFLGSPEGSWMTGQILVADGGLTIV